MVLELLGALEILLDLGADEVPELLVLLVLVRHVEVVEAVLVQLERLLPVLLDVLVDRLLDQLARFLRRQSSRRPRHSRRGSSCWTPWPDPTWNPCSVIDLAPPPTRPALVPSRPRPSARLAPVSTPRPNRPVFRKSPVLLLLYEMGKGSLMIAASPAVHPLDSFRCGKRSVLLFSRLD